MDSAASAADALRALYLGAPQRAAHAGLLTGRQVTADGQWPGWWGGAHVRLSVTFGMEGVVAGRIRTADGLGTGVIRCFISSTFTDTANERNAILQFALPEVQEYARRMGYEFDVSEMRWGVSKDAANNHGHNEVCLREIRACQSISEGISFVSLLGQKYGFRPFPAQILEPTYQAIRAALPSDDDRSLVDDWFVLDTNAVPPHYALLPITSHFPDFGNETNEEAAKAASAQWWQTFERIQTLLRSAAQAVLPPAEAIPFVESITEAETRLGLRDEYDPANKAVWFKRTIDKIEARAKEDPATAKLFIDFKGDELDSEAIELLRQLKDEFIPSTSMSKIHNYQVTQWADGGINPTNSEHAEYLKSLCDDFVEEMKASIDAAAARASALRDDSLYVEIAHHHSLCRERCASFHGRHDVLQSIADYLAMDASSGLPALLAVHGISGCGKTSVMAKAALNFNDMAPNAVTVLRFLGTSTYSGNSNVLLQSICEQIARAYGLEGRDEYSIPADYPDRVEKFPEFLAVASSSKPLVLFLDSLDQLGGEFGGRKLGWLPKKDLPPHVHIVVSTLPEDKYFCMPSLRAAIGAVNSNFVEVPRLPLSEAPIILDDWLQEAERTLSEPQRAAILTAFEQCPIPLYLKLCFDTAKRWPSTMPPEQSVLEPTVRGMIDALFASLERQYGKVYVARALGAITAARRGLSISELHDFLALDDQVLDAVFEWWIPPFRRIPPSLFARVRALLGGFLIERGAQGAQVLQWHHRQFIEAAYDRYLGDKSERMAIHSTLADVFSGKWAGKSKPFSNSPAKVARFKVPEHDTAERYVARQPWLFEALPGEARRPNLRKLDELPFHLEQIQAYDELQEQCLLQFNFLLLKFRHFGQVDVLEDLARVPEKVASTSVKQVMSVVRLTAVDNANELGSQLRGRLLDEAERSPAIATLVEAAASSPANHSPCLVPVSRFLDPPSTALFRTWTLDDKLHRCAVSRDGRLCAVASENRNIYVYDVQSGQQIKILGPHDWIARGVAFSADGSRIGTLSWSGQAFIWRLDDDSYEQEGELWLPDRMHGETMVFHPHNSNLVAVGGLFGAALMDFETKTVDFMKLGDLDGIENAAERVCFSPDGTILAASASCGYFGIFDVKSRTLIKSWSDSPGKGLAFTPDGRFLLCAGANLVAANLETHNLRHIDIPGSWKNGLSVDGELLAFGDNTAIHVMNLLVDDSVHVHLVNTIECHSQMVSDVALCGQKLFSCSIDRTFRVLNALEKHEKPAMEQSSFDCSSEVVSADGRVSLRADGTSVVITVDGVEHTMPKRHNKTLIGKAVSRSGNWALTTSKDGHATLWDVANIDNPDNGKALQHMKYDPNNFNRIVPGVGFVGDQYALTGGWDNKLKLWAIPSGELLDSVTFEGALDAVCGHDDGFVHAKTRDNHVGQFRLSTTPNARASTDPVAQGMKKFVGQSNKGSACCMIL
eukprot:m.62581 g.62581  ORF g.62581 m.62581 type:complete len:1460 (-) comp7407_c0_seq2:100-4479(-)